MENQSLDVLQRLNKIEEQLTEIKTKHLGLVDYILNQKTDVKSFASSVSKNSMPDANPKFNQEEIENIKTAKPKLTTNAVTQDSSKLAASLLPLVAIFCFVFAGVFIIKLAIDSGWLTATRQWGLVCLLGVALVAAGRLITKLDKNYRAYLSAAGIIILYIAAISSNLYFKLFSNEIALGLAVLNSIFCLYLADYHSLELFTILTALGTYFAPLLLGHDKDLLFYTAYFLIVAALFSYLSVLFNSRALILISSYLGVGLFATFNLNLIEKQDLLIVILVLIAQFCIFSSAVLNYSVKHKQAMTTDQSALFFPILIFFYGITYYFLNKLNSELAPWISLSFCFFILAFYLTGKKYFLKFNRDLNSGAVVFGFVTVILVHSGYMVLLPSVFKPWIVPLILLAKLIETKEYQFPKALKFINVVLGALFFIEYLNICGDLLAQASIDKTLPAVIAVIIGFSIYFNRKNTFAQHKQIALGLLHILALLSLYSITKEANSFVVSLAWGVYSIIVLSLGYVKKDIDLTKSSLIIFIVTSCKALLYDLSSSATVIRISSLLVTGLILYCAGYVFKKISLWQKDMT